MGHRMRMLDKRRLKPREKMMLQLISQVVVWPVVREIRIVVRKGGKLR